MLRIRREVPTRLVIFPDENHWVLNHLNRSVPLPESTELRLISYAQLEMALRSLKVVR